MSILFFLLLAALFVFLQYRSAARGTDGLTYDFSSDRLVECGEPFSVTSTLINRRQLPILFLKLSETVPEVMTVQPGQSGASVEDHFTYGAEPVRIVKQTFYLMPHQKLTRTLTAEISRRGCYRLLPARIELGDVLGLKEHAENYPRRQEIVVYPKKAELSGFDTAFGNWYGDVSVRRFILPDPILTIGFREYSGREPMKDISWPQTLRSGKLMVKEYDYTSEPSVTVLLHVPSKAPDDAEACFSAMRTVCERLEADHISYRVYSDAITPGGIAGTLRANDGCGVQHLAGILDGLGRASANESTGFRRLLSGCRSEDDTGRGYILVSGPLTAPENAALSAFEQRTGRRVLRVTSAGGEPS